MEGEYKRKRGDRRDGRWVKEAPSLQTVMAHLFPNRTDNECYLNDTLDITEVLKYVNRKNELHPDYKTTVFHCLIFAIGKMIYERPKMNWFIQGHRIYERFEITESFICRRRFTDKSEEALMFFHVKGEDTLDSLSYDIAGKVHETRKSEVATGGVDELLNKFAAMPRVLLMIVVRLIRYLDFWGINPKFITDGDTNYSTVLLSNLGSVGAPSVYHHLNNYGTNSIMVTLGVIRHEGDRDLVDIGVTLDERIADGFYFARSLKLVKYLFAHPEMMDETISSPSGFDYNNRKFQGGEA